MALPSGCVHAFRFAPDAEGWVLSLAADLMGDARIAALFEAGELARGAPRWLELAKAGRQARRLVYGLGAIDQHQQESRVMTRLSCIGML